MPSIQTDPGDQIPIVVELWAVRQVVTQGTGRMQLVVPNLSDGCVDSPVRPHQLGQNIGVVVVNNRTLVCPDGVLLEPLPVAATK